MDSQSRNVFFEKTKNLELVLQNAPLILVCTDASGTVTLSTGKGLESIGQARNQTVGKNVFKDYANSPDIVNSTKKALAGIQVEFVLRWKDLTFKSTYSPLTDDDGHVIGCVMVSVNITDVTDAQRKLETYREQTFFSAK